MACDKSSSASCVLKRSKNDTLSDDDMGMLWDNAGTIEVLQLYRETRLDTLKADEPLISETYAKQAFVNKWRNFRLLHILELN